MRIADAGGRTFCSTISVLSTKCLSINLTCCLFEQLGGLQLCGDVGEGSSLMSLRHSPGEKTQTHRIPGKAETHPKHGRASAAGAFTEPGLFRATCAAENTTEVLYAPLLEIITNYTGGKKKSILPFNCLANLMK